MRLLIDLGHTRIKWGLERARRIERVSSLARPPERVVETLAEAWRDIAPSEVIISAVGEPSALRAIADCSLRNWGLDAQCVRVTEHCHGVTNGYDEPTALGADRWVNLIAARTAARGRDVIVADVGSAITLDAVRASGQHLGGAILAGCSAARAGLAGVAPTLPTPDGTTELPARSTRAALAAGFTVGTAGAIDRLAADLAAHLREPLYYVCGGDGESLSHHMKRDWLYDPLLTLRGIALAREDGCVGSL